MYAGRLFVKYLLIFISIFLFTLGCGNEGKEESASNERNESVQPELVFMKTKNTNPKKDILDLADELKSTKKSVIDEKRIQQEEQLPDETKTDSLEENPTTVLIAKFSSDEPEEEPLGVVKEQAPAAFEELAVEDNAVEEVFTESIDDEQALVVVEEDSSEKDLPEENLAENDSSGDVSEQSDAVVETASSVASLSLAVCRGALTQLKNSCDFMPEWLKNVQAENEDVTIRRTKHGIVVTWNKGIFKGGVFKGLWRDGTCERGTMESVIWDQGVFGKDCVWKNGLWGGGSCQAEDCSHTETSDEQRATEE